MKKTETKSVMLLKHHLKALRLPTILAECEKAAARCAKENVDHLAFLLQLCELELLEREKRAADRRLKAACFPNYKTLEDFDFAAQPSLSRVLISELMRGVFIERRESVILVGNPGTGKNAYRHCIGCGGVRAGKESSLLESDGADHHADGGAGRTSALEAEETALAAGSSDPG